MLSNKIRLCSLLVLFLLCYLPFVSTYSVSYDCRLSQLDPDSYKQEPFGTLIIEGGDGPGAGKCDPSETKIKGHCFNDESGAHDYDKCGSASTVNECYLRGLGAFTADDYSSFSEVACDENHVCYDGHCVNAVSQMIEDGVLVQFLSTTAPNNQIEISYKPVLDTVADLEAVIEDVTLLRIFNNFGSSLPPALYFNTDNTNNNLISDLSVYPGISRFRTNVVVREGVSNIAFTLDHLSVHSSNVQLIFQDEEGDVVYDNYVENVGSTGTTFNVPVEAGKEYEVFLLVQFMGGAEDDVDFGAFGVYYANTNLNSVVVSLTTSQPLNTLFRTINVESFNEADISCTDGSDNDNDGFIDIHDADCGVVNAVTGFDDYCGDTPGNDPTKFDEVGKVVRFNAYDHICRLDSKSGGLLPWSAYWDSGTEGDVVSINNDTNEGSRYDVVNYGGVWRACDKDNDLGNYASGISNPFTTYLDRFVCYAHPDGSERIEECEDFARDRLLEVEGNWLSSIENTLTFSQSDKRYILRVNDDLQNVQGFDYLEFDVKFNNYDDLNLNVAGKDFVVKDHTTSASSLDRWLHVLIPLAGISDVDEIYFHSTNPKSDDPTLVDVANAFFLHKPGVEQYCAVSQGSVLRWIEDLDLDTGVVGSKAGNSCDTNSEAFAWTGSGCCGDDLHEFFSDDVGCFDSIATEKNEVVSGYPNIIFSDDGRFYQCGGNDYASRFVNPDSFVQADDCMLVGNFFCSYNNLWIPAAADGLVISASSSLPDGSESACCPEDYCWDGDQCLPSQVFDPEAEPFTYNNKDYICSFGTWSVAVLKADWDFKRKGYCPDVSDCLVNPQGDDDFYNVDLYYENPSSPAAWPACIENNQFVGDHYCLDGNWSSRTKFIANALLGLVDDGDDYSLYCDVKDRALNYFDKDLVDVNAFNNFCILKKNDDVIVGVSVNPVDTLENSLDNAFNISDFNLLCSDAFENEVGFERCQSGDLWFNNETQVVVYSPDGVGALEGSFFGNIYDSFLRPILELVGIVNPEQIIYGNLDFINNTQDFNQIFIKTSGDKVLRGVIESKADQSGNVFSFVTAQFVGFNDSVCDSVYAFDQFRANPGRVNILCNDSNNEVKFVVRQGQPGLSGFKIEELWVEALPSSRFE